MRVNNNSITYFGLYRMCRGPLVMITPFASQRALSLSSGLDTCGSALYTWCYHIISATFNTLRYWFFSVCLTVCPCYYPRSNWTRIQKFRSNKRVYISWKPFFFVFRFCSPQPILSSLTNTQHLLRPSGLSDTNIYFKPLICWKYSQNKKGRQ